MTEVTKQELYAQLQEKVNAAYRALDEAKALAVEHKLTFHFGAAYGMGGEFIGDPEMYASYRDYDDGQTSGWFPSSQSC